MPTWTLKTPRNDDPGELLKFLQELIQYLKYISEHLDGDNVPMLKNLNDSIKSLEATYNQKFEEFETWKTQVNNDIEYIKSKLA